MNQVNEFQLARPIGRRVYRERFKDQEVAVKVIKTADTDDFLPVLFDVQKSLLKLRHSNIVRYLELVCDDQSEPRVRFVVMELYLGSLADYSKGKMTNVKMETSGILWQVALGLDHLRWYRKTLLDVSFAGRLRAVLQTEKILIAEHKGQTLLKLQIDLEGPFIDRKDVDEMPSLGRLARELTSQNDDPHTDRLFWRFVDLLEHPDRNRRPESFDLVLCHPYFILSREESRQRVVNLLKSKAKIFPLLFNGQELARWHLSTHSDLKCELRNEEMSDVQQLLEKYPNASQFGRLLDEGRQRAPLITCHFLYEAMVAVSFSRNCCHGRPLHLAAQDSGNVGLVRLLLETGTDLEARDRHGQTALHLAAGHNVHVDIARLLLDKGADVRAVNVDGHTPLHLAAGHNANPQVAALLMDRGADWRLVNQSGNSPLHLAASFNRNPEVLRLIIQKTGLDLRCQGGPLVYLAAAFNSNVQVLKLLLVRGADPNHVVGGVSTLLNVISAIYPPPNADNVNTLLDYGANLAAVDNEGRSVLHLAVLTNQSTDLIRLLIHRGANKKTVDAEGKSALQLAREAKCCQQIVNLLKI